jgi:protocatechuate 3,4-dioxygenase beta subunit
MKNRALSLALLIPILITPLVLVPASQAASCLATQALTEGPYYSTDTPVRTNIAPGEVGTKTKITITVVDSRCKAVQGARVDIWHANALGQYSAVEGVSGNFARGTQTTNASGKVTFTTIYPGWYPGRTMHIHFKIWKKGSEVLTSQFFASDSNNSRIYTSGAYAARGNQNTPLAADRIYGSLKNPAALTLKLSIGSTISGSAKVVI